MTDMPAHKPTGQRQAIIAWAALLVFETVAQVALKAGGDSLSDLSFGVGWLAAAASDPWVLAGILGYVGSFAAWMTILDRMPLSFSFPLTAMVMLSVALASFLIFGETLTPWRTVGIGLIIAGVVVMGGDEA